MSNTCRTETMTFGHPPLHLKTNYGDVNDFNLTATIYKHIQADL